MWRNAANSQWTSQCTSIRKGDLSCWLYIVFDTVPQRLQALKNNKKHTYIKQQDILNCYLKTFHFSKPVYALKNDLV